MLSVSRVGRHRGERARARVLLSTVEQVGSRVVGTACIL